MHLHVVAIVLPFDQHENQIRLAYSLGCIVIEKHIFLFVQFLWKNWSKGRVSIRYDRLKSLKNSIQKVKNIINQSCQNFFEKIFNSSGNHFLLYQKYLFLSNDDASYLFILCIFMQCTFCKHKPKKYIISFPFLISFIKY